MPATPAAQPQQQQRQSLPAQQVAQAALRCSAALAVPLLSPHSLHYCPHPDQLLALLLPALQQQQQQYYQQDLQQLLHLLLVW
jgi:hypothetical protein